MKRFSCVCEMRNALFFESVQCTACGRLVGYCPDQQSMLAFEADTENAGLWRHAELPIAYRQCANYSDYQVCNWMVRCDEDETLCRACRLNAVIPDLSLPQNIDYWRRIESAKRHTLYSILKLNLPLASRREDPERGLTFLFMSDSEPTSEFTEHTGQAPVFTGHNDGEITINLAEADDIARTRTRIKLGEVYRTLLGHFRHEIGHYYWYRLIENNAELVEKFRALFGDERADYDAALQRHYNEGAPADWADRFISPYASMHPWEDWAECWAHYLHMTDTLETAYAFQLGFKRAATKAARNPDAVDTNADATTLMQDWMQLSIGINALNRSMGMPDPYPFVLIESTREKLQWIHQLLQE